MKNSKEQPLDSSNEGAEVIILDEALAEIEPTPRPLTGARLEALKQQLAKEAELHAHMKKLEQNETR